MLLLKPLNLKPKRRPLALLALLLTGAAFSQLPLAALAQDAFPDKPVKLIVPVAAGGGVDTAFRTIAPYWGELLGQQVVVENRPGAGQVIGIDAVAKSKPDGYTLAGVGVPIAFNTALGKKLPYDPVKDFIGVSTVASTPILFAVRPGVAANSLAELVRLAKAKPGGLNFATTGTGGSTRVVLELLNQSAGVDIRYVPYKGAAPGITDLLGGVVDGMAVDFPVLYPFVKEGKLRGIAISSEARNPLLPELRTAAEQGMPELTCGNWSSLMVPAKTPRAIVDAVQWLPVKR